MAQYDFSHPGQRPESFWERNWLFLSVFLFWAVVIAWHYWPTWRADLAPVAAYPARPSKGLFDDIFGILGPLAFAAVVIRLLWSVFKVLAMWMIGLAGLYLIAKYLY